MIWVMHTSLDIPKYLRYDGFNKQTNLECKNIIHLWIIYRNTDIPEYLYYENCGSACTNKAKNLA